MNENTILVIEDEPSVGEVVCLYLRRAGYQVNLAANGENALQLLQQGFPMLLVLDLMMPGIDGWEITRWVRSRSDVPIIMLTARGAEVDRIAGLEMGADDYVVKPFSPQELVSRVRAVLRRTHPLAAEETRALTLGEIFIDPAERRVTVRGEEKSLTSKEFDLLLLLSRYPRQVFTREQLLERIWGLADYIDPSTVTVHIRRLREKIEEDPAAPHHLITVWGVGYKIEP